MSLLHLTNDVSTGLPLGTTPVGYPAFNQWKTTRDQLAKAIQVYADECAALVFACSRALQRQSDKTELNRALISLNEELPLIASDEARLLTARLKLNTLRNQSTSISAISILPAEILGRVFLLSYLSCVHSHKSHKNQQFVCPIVFASVCTSWRQVAFGTAQLWCHVDLTPNASPSYKLYKRAQVWIKRAGNAPLHVHVHERTCAKDQDVEQLIAFLSPYMTRLCTLHIDTECHTLDLFESVLACWLEHGSPLKALTLRRPKPIPLMASLEPQNLRRLPNARLGGFLQSLRTLHLHNICIGWGANTAHSGLVELELESLASNAGPTIQELVAILRGCSRLQKLKLAGINFRHSNTDAEILPVRLGYLRELNLLGVNCATLKLLLPALDTGLAPLAMSIALGTHEDLFDELNCFLKRSNLSTLYIDAQYQEWAPQLFGSLKPLQTLVIGNFALMQSIYAESTTGEAPEPTICASLRSLSFIGCNIGMGPLQNMLKAHPNLEELNLWRCKLTTADAELNGHDNLVEIVRPILTSLVPQVTYSSCLKDYPMTGWYVSDENDASSVRIPT